MIKWIKKYASFAKPTESFNEDYVGGIWLSAENRDMFDGLPMYDYFSSNEDLYDGLGVLRSWEEALQERGFYSEWHDAGTVMLWPIDQK